MKKNIHLITHGGLGNRMRVLASAAYIAKSTKSNLIIYWPTNKELNCKMELIFSDIGIEYSKPNYLSGFIYKLIFRHGVIKIISSALKHSFKIFGKDLIFDSDTIKIKESNNPLIFFEENNYIIATCSGFVKEIEFNSFRLTNSLWNKVQNNFLAFGKDYYGIHIRRTDHQDIINSSPLEAYETILNKILKNEPTSKFFLATDDISVKKLFINKYQSSILHLDVKLTRNSIEGIYGGVLELYLLSKSKGIICSKLSSYSNTAISLGNIKNIFYI